MRAAVIGAGHISKQHLAALAECADVSVVGVCDLSAVMAEVAAERFRIESWFTDYRRMLDEKHPDVVHILTPPSTHFAIARDCLQRGAHILAEKPITEEFGQLEELIAVAQAENRQLVEDHNYQFNRGIVDILKVVQNGRLGQVRHVDINLCLAVPGRKGSTANSLLIHDFLTHLCYLSYTFIGEHRQVHTVWRSPTDAGHPTVENMQSLVEGECATARIGFSTDSQPDSFTVRVQGTRMLVETNLFEVGAVRTALLGGPKPLMPIRNMVRRGGREWVNASRSLCRKLGGGPGPYEGMWELIRLFYDSLNRGTNPPVSTQQILAVNALYRDILREVPAPCAC